MSRPRGGGPRATVTSPEGPLHGALGRPAHHTFGQCPREVAVQLLRSQGTAQAPGLPARCWQGQPGATAKTPIPWPRWQRMAVGKTLPLGGELRLTVKKKVTWFSSEIQSPWAPWTQSGRCARERPDWSCLSPCSAQFLGAGCAGSAGVDGSATGAGGRRAGPR